MQLVNKFCYNIAVGRAQMRIALKCIIRTGENGKFIINWDKYMIGDNETMRLSKEQLVDWITKEVDPDNNCFECITIRNLLEFSQFEQIWSIIVPRESLNGLKNLAFTDMPFAMGEPVMSALTKSATHSLTDLNLSKNASWWQDNTLF